MNNPFEITPSQPYDEEAEVADFLPPELALEGHASLSSDWRLEYLDRLHLTMEDPRFVSLSPTAQLLYLHFLKRTYGRGEREVRVSVDRLVADTKLAWMTIQKHLKTLTSMGLLSTRQPAHQRVAPTYFVHWLPKLEKPAALKALVTRYDQLDQEDLAEIQRLTPLLSAQQREDMSTDIQSTLRDVGLIPSPDFVRKILHYRLLTIYPYKHKLMVKHPDWFGLQSVQ